METESMNESQFENLKNAAIWHKEQCAKVKDTECNVSLFLLGVTAVKILGRDLTEEEQKIFI